ncbi:synaptonemal complex protein 2 isoform X3 [Entelurus aequoreus]|uniref:synaptonemal complex protein 2 isoform X3 n=1 Tax=Entelurus aequoreus TaxID=161455 RepID=UPI002B1D3FE5|nr:synaptonemal complex protein 2 isoform X3 [Entelurus aequoreus]
MTSELEKALEDILKSGDHATLNGFLRNTTNVATPIKCPQRFLNKLDVLMTGSLEQNDSTTACEGLAILHKCGKNLKLPDGSQGLSGIITQGLIKKMVQWFEKCKKLWIQRGSHSDEYLSRLSENFFDAVMVVHEASQEGAYGITESFLYSIGQLVIDARIYIVIKKEAIRKLNMILEKIPVELKKDKKILTSQEASEIMTKLAGQILHCGDYDLQIALIEALFRMTTPIQRKQLTDHWFSMAHVAGAFVQIQVSEFEADCRSFLNFVNGIQGDRRRVHSFPCLAVYLDKFELLMPADDKLKEFWIDFNLGSQCISFYFSCAEEKSQTGLWDTICISENEVQSYIVTEMGTRQVLKLQLSDVVMAGMVEGSSLAIHFSSTFDILQTVGYIYGNKKNKNTVGKISVVKTTVNVIMEEGSSQQTVVPESQISLGNSDKNTASHLIQARSTSAKTPTKIRISESTICISSSSKGSVHCPSSFLSGAIPSRKPSLEMRPASDRKRETIFTEETTSDENVNRGPSPYNTKSDDSRKQNIPIVIATGMMLAAQGTDQSQDNCFVPDTQPVTERNASHWSKMSVSEMLMMPTQKISSLSKLEVCSNLTKQQKCLSSALKVPYPTSIKPHHTQPIQRQQEVIRGRNTVLGPKEAFTAETLTFDPNGSKGKPFVDSSNSNLCIPKDVETLGKSLGKKKSRGKSSLVTDVLSVKTPIEASIYNQERTPNERDVQVAGSMVKLISSHYTKNNQTKGKVEHVPQHWVPSQINRPLFNMSWVSTRKKNVEAGDVTKSHNRDKSNSNYKRKDVFTFYTDESFSVGGKDKTLFETSSVSSKGAHHSSVQTNTKREPTSKLKQNVKKKLFSDTDTDYGTTDVSWLKETSKKPNIFTYGKNPLPTMSKARQPNTSNESLILPPKHRKSKPNKNIPNMGQTMEQPKNVSKSVAVPGRPSIANRRPQRAAASSKNYKETETDESQSESDKALTSKNKSKEWMSKTQKSNATDHMNKTKSTGKNTTKTCKKLKENPYGCQSEFLTNQRTPFKTQEISFHGSKSNLQIHAQEQRNMSKCPLPTPQTSPSPIEKMRSHARSNQSMDLPRSPLLSQQGSPLCSSPNLTCQETFSPISRLPKPHYADASSFCTMAPKTMEKSQIQQQLSPALQSSISASPCPLLTSTKLTAVPSSPNSPFPKTSISHHIHCSFSQESTVSQLSLNLSVCSSRIELSPIAAEAVCQKTEKTPYSYKDSSNSQHISGPSRKRCIPLSSSSEEEEEKIEKNKTRRTCPSRLKPRRLLNTFTEVLPESEMNQVLSTSCNVSNHWYADKKDGEMDMEVLELPDALVNPSNLCQQFSSELKKKFQNRFKIMDGYNKQGIKTVQQHVSSFRMQLDTHRTQKFEKVKNVLLEEINKLEQRNTVLNTMEKDLNIYFKKQCSSFQSYREEETKRQVVLKKALESDICPSLEYEGRLFTSQMALIRKDLKTVQERLLKKMQEEEFQSVKRGLQALLFSDGVSE